MTKNQRIKETRRFTKERRKSQICKVYELKLDKSHLSKTKRTYLNRLFLENKWLYNNILGTDDTWNYNCKPKEVTILNKDKTPETRSLTNLSSQMRQGVLTRLKYSIMALAAKKKKGERVGPLKFKKRVNSVFLQQYNNTYRIKGKHLRLQGFKKSFKLIGLKQIPEDTEIATANLVRKCDDYYLHIACYLPKEEPTFEKHSVGIDFGIRTSLTFDNGEKYNFSFHIPDGLKKLQRKLKHKKPNSKNKKKLNGEIVKKYNKLTNQKKDAKNKIVSYITKTYKIVCIQDENIKGWHEKYFGVQVQHSILGGIMSDLKRKSHTLSLVDRYFPSTKLCPACNMLNNSLTLNDREFKCQCGYHEDRDIHAAKNILYEGLLQQQTGVGRISSMSAEKSTSNQTACIESSQVDFVEAGSLVL